MIAEQVRASGRRRPGVRIRLLTSVAGDGPVFGDAGDELVVDAAVARVWADGVRAELVPDPPG